MKIPELLVADRLVVRPLHDEDLQHFVKFMTDQEATEHLAFSDEQKTPEGAYNLFTEVINSYATDQPHFALAIADKETDEYLGSCGLACMGEDPSEVECFYTLLPAAWRKGLATEAMGCLLDYAFTELAIDRIVARVSLENPRSWQVAERLGMQSEGVQHFDDLDRTGKIYAITKMAFVGRNKV